MSSVSREASRTSDVNPSIYVERGIEGLWLLTAALVPLIFVPTNFMMSEAINAYVEVPKTTAFRFLVGLMDYPVDSGMGAQGRAKQAI